MESVRGIGIRDGERQRGGDRASAEDRNVGGAEGLVDGWREKDSDGGGYTRLINDCMDGFDAARGSGECFGGLAVWLDVCLDARERAMNRRVREDGERRLWWHGQPEQHIEIAYGDRSPIVILEEAGGNGGCIGNSNQVGTSNVSEHDERIECGREPTNDIDGGSRRICSPPIVRRYNCSTRVAEVAS